MTTSALLPTFARADLSFERGEGSWLFDSKGDAYLDAGGGIAVNSLGHAHPHLVGALVEQAQKVWHVSNLMRIPGGERLAERLVAASFADKAFFVNSGAEANECAIKMARKFHAHGGHPERYRILTFEGAFHGRTLATIAAGGQQKYIDGFGPKVEGFDQVSVGDGTAVERWVGPESAAFMIEPIMAEGGVRVVEPQFLRHLRSLADKHGLMLIFDEVQTGVGRSGRFFAHEKIGVIPDILSVAKGIGGGFPLGACLATENAARGMTVGAHGTTFGGNPLAMACGNAVLDVVLAPGFLEEVERKALLLKQRLAELKDRHPGVIAEIRGDGLLIGIRLETPNADFTSAARDEKLLVVPAGDNTVRLLPPLTITDAEIAELMHRLDAAATRVEEASPRRAAE